MCLFQTYLGIFFKTERNGLQFEMDLKDDCMHTSPELLVLRIASCFKYLVPLRVTKGRYNMIEVK